MKVAGKPKRLEHPKSVYIIGFIFKIVTLLVFIGVTYQVTFSHHGPGLLIPMKKKMDEKQFLNSKCLKVWKLMILSLN